MKELFKQYAQNLINNKEEYIEDYKDVFYQVQNCPAKYKGKPVEFLYQPMFLTEDDFKRFEDLIYKLNNILNKVIDKYLSDEKFRQYFAFNDQLEKLILKDPGYDENVPMGRFDIFYHYNYHFQFCELNADGSSGMTEARELERILKGSLGVREMENQYTFQGFELFDSWIDTLLKNYQQYAKSSEKPNVAIVDWIPDVPPSEFVEFQKAFQKRDIDTVIADPRDLKYKNGKLYYNDFRVDCIYRRLVTWEMIERADEIEDVINAYLDGNICMVGSIRSQIIHNKIIFAILHDPLKTPFLNDEERAFIQMHIPYTKEFYNSDEELVDFTIKNKDRLVLKPMDKYASFGVRIGRDFTTKEWQSIIEKEAKEGYLLQELCDIPKISMAMFSDEGLSFEENNYIIGLFVYNGKVQGVYTRVGRKNIIGSVAECFTVPNFILKKKYNL